MDELVRLGQAIFSQAHTRPTDAVDIFRVHRDGPFWLDSSETIEAANVRIRQLGVVFPGVYMLSDSKTGARHVIECGA